MNKKLTDNTGILISIIFICIFLLFPWYLWYQEARENRILLKDYKVLKNEIKDINKLIDGIADLTEKNKELALSENKYISLYCTSVKFSTSECKNFITQTQNAIVKTEESKNKILNEMLNP